MILNKQLDLLTQKTVFWTIIYLASVIAASLGMILTDSATSLFTFLLMLVFWPLTFFFWLNEGMLLIIPFCLLYPVLYFTFFQPFIVRKRFYTRLIIACIVLVFPFIYTVLSLQQYEIKHSTTTQVLPDPM